MFRTLQPPVRGSLKKILPITVTGWENVPMSGPVIFAGNHSGWLDGPLVVIMAPRPVRCLVKSELYHGVLGWALTTVGQIPVNRGKPDRTALTRLPVGARRRRVRRRLPRGHPGQR